METEIYPDKDKCKTGYTCPKSGRYFCEGHPVIEVTVIKGNLFPKCYQGAGHNTTWIYVD